MGLSIKHAETERKVRAVAKQRGHSMTRVVHDLADEALKREGPSEAEQQAYVDRVMKAAAKFWEKLPPGPLPTEKEMDSWLYDEDGNPSR